MTMTIDKAIEMSGSAKGDGTLLDKVVNPYLNVKYFAKFKGRIVLVLDDTYSVDDDESEPEVYPLHRNLTCPRCGTVGLLSAVSSDPPLDGAKLRPRRKCFACWHTTNKQIWSKVGGDYGKDLPEFHYHVWTAEEIERLSSNHNGHDFED